MKANGSRASNGDLNLSPNDDNVFRTSILSSEDNAGGHQHFARHTYWNSHRHWKSSRMNPEWRQLYLNRAKLKAVSRTSALIAGFAMVAMVEVQIQEKELYPEWLLISFSVNTTALVTVHLFALMISTCMLPNIEAVSSFHQSNAIQNSPHHRMRKYVEMAWILSTGIGLVLFLIEIALLIWLKFIPLNKCTVNCPTKPPTPQNQDILTAHKAAWAATMILIPVVILFAGFAFHFYMTLAKHRYSLINKKLADLYNQDENREILPDRMEMMESNFQPMTSQLNSPMHSHRSSLSHFSNHNI